MARNRGLQAALTRVGLAQHRDAPRTGVELTAPSARQARELATVQRDQQRSEVTTPDSNAWSDGVHVRVRVGQQTDNSWGLRVYDEDGVLVNDLTEIGNIGGHVIMDDAVAVDQRQALDFGDGLSVSNVSDRTIVAADVTQDDMDALNSEVDDLAAQVASFGPSAIPVVTALPGSPAVWDEVIYQTAAMAAQTPPAWWRMMWDGSGWRPVGGTPPRARVTKGAITAFATGSYISWDSALEDRGGEGLHWVAATPDRLYSRRGGSYHFSVRVEHSASTVGSYRGVFMHNSAGSGTNMPSHRHGFVSSFTSHSIISATLDLAAGDYVKVGIIHNASPNPNTNFARAEWHWVAP